MHGSAARLLYCISWAEQLHCVRGQQRHAPWRRRIRLQLLPGRRSGYQRHSMRLRCGLLRLLPGGGSGLLQRLPCRFLPAAVHLRVDGLPALPCQLPDCGPHCRRHVAGRLSLPGRLLHSGGRELPSHTAWLLHLLGRLRFAAALWQQSGHTAGRPGRGVHQLSHKQRGSLGLAVCMHRRELRPLGRRRGGRQRHLHALRAQ